MAETFEEDTEATEPLLLVDIVCSVRVEELEDPDSEKYVNLEEQLDDPNNERNVKFHV